jgi:hypothetical protein
LQAIEASGDEAFAPESDGMSITVQLRCDMLVSGLVVLSGAEDEAAAEGECLRGGTGLDQRMKLFAIRFGEGDG